MDNQDEIQDSQTDETTNVNVEPTLEDYNELASKNKELYARLKKVEAKAKEVKLAPAEKASIKSADSDSNITERLDRIELQTKGYADSEVDFILRNGGKKALDDEFVKAAIETKRQQAKAENATVDTDSAKSDIEKKYTQDQLKEMSVADLEKILPRA